MTDLRKNRLKCSEDRRSGLRCRRCWRQNLKQQVRVGVDIEFLGNFKSHRRNQQNGGDIVQKSRKYGRYDGQHEQQSARIGFNSLNTPDGHILEHTGFSEMPTMVIIPTNREMVLKSIPCRAVAWVKIPLKIMTQAPRRATTARFSFQ